MENLTISHGISTNSSKNVVLENVTLSEAKAQGWVKFDLSIGEYILV